MDSLPNGDTIGVRNSNENTEVQEEESPRLIEVVVTEAVDEAADSPDRNSSLSSASAPLAESEESEQSETEKMGPDDEPKHDEEAAVPRLQLLPLPRPGVSPNWTSSEKFDDKATKLDLSNLKLQPSKTSLLSAMDKIKVPKPKIAGKTADDTKLRFFVGFLFLAVSLLIGGAHVLYYQHLGEASFFDDIEFDEWAAAIELFPHVTYEEASRTLRFSSPETDSHIIELTLGVGISSKVKPFDCAHDPHGPEDHDHKCLEWYNIARLNIAHYIIKDTINCYNLYWQSLSKNVSPMDCFPTGAEYSHLFHDAASNETEGVKEDSKSDRDQGQWYGGGESLQAAWPLQKGHIKLSPFVTGDEGQTEWGNAIRKYFVNSRGVSLKVADHTPLFVSLNDPPRSGLCLQARFDDFAYYYHRFNLPRLNYTICTAKNVRKLHYELLPKSFWDGHKQRDIDTLHHLLKTPIWQVPPDETFSHEALERYIERTVGANKRQGQEDSGLGQGYLLLDYHWQKHMGDLKFDTTNFPNPNATVQMVKDHGLKLVLTVSPFISTESINFAPGVKSRIFVGQRKSDERVPALTWYKDISSCGMLDLTSNATAVWFKQQLRSLVQDLDIDLNSVSHHDETSESEELLTSLNVETPVTFFLQTGNSFHTPSYFKFDVDLDNPDLFRDYFVGHVMEEVPVIGVSGASSSRPKAPAFVFMSPLEPKWSHLKSIIPNVLQLSVIGYPFINPGPVGGVPNLSQPENSTMTKQEELELYVRWWQLNTFLPMLHFVKPPTSFTDPIMNGIAKSLKSIRTKVVLPEMIRSANEAMHSSAPIIRPLWMIDPLNPITHSIDDQFLIGDRILVAPVLDHGVRERNVYLPKFEDDADDDTVIWKRGTDGTFYKGGKWLNGTKVPLSDVLYFVRQKSDTLPGLGQV